MDPYQETFNTWNKVAALYQDKFMHLDLYNDTYDRFCDLLNSQQASILDVGCGPGNITRYLLSKRSGFLIQGIDIAPAMIGLAEKNNPAAGFKVMDSRQIRSLATTFDGIMCGFCLPYLSPADCSAFINDCSQLLHEQGILYLSFVEGSPEASGYQAGSSGDRTFFYYHALATIKKDLAENSFEVTDLIHKNYIKQDGTAETHTILMARLL